MMRHDCSFCNGTGTKPDTIFQDCMECSGMGWFDDVTDAGYKRSTPLPVQAPTQPDNAQPTPVGGALEAMTDDDLKARAEAAWSYLFVYLDEIRRRAGIAAQSEEIPF